MATARRNWIEILVTATLCLGICAVAFAQPDPDRSLPPRSIQIQSPQSGSLSGKLTDLHSAPLSGVAVVLRNASTSAELRATTSKNGSFRFASLGVGEYTLEADEPTLGHGSLEGISITGGIESRVQAAIHFEPVAPPMLASASPNRSTAPQQSIASASPPMLASASPDQRPAPDRSAAPQQSIAPAPPPMQLAASAPHSSAETPRASPLTSPHTIDAPVPTLPQAAFALAPLRAVRSAPAATPLPSQPANASQIAIPAQIARPRAQLETESATLEPLPAPAPSMQRLSLQARFEPAHLESALALNAGSVVAAAAAGSLQAAMLHNLSHLGPVVAASQKPEPVGPAVATTISAMQLQSLPVSGRRWQEFLLDTPSASAPAGTAQPSFRGSQEPAEITVDGASMRLAFGVAAGSASGLQATNPSIQGEEHKNSLSPSWAGGRGPAVSEAAIREVETTAGNVEAEGMRSAGGRTGIRTQGGTDSLHGQGFFFDRQNTWGARNPFTQWVTQTAPATLTYNPSGPPLSVPIFDNGANGPPESFTPPDHEMIWGIGAGGQIRRDKLFWFAALDSYRRNDPGLSMVKHPYLVNTPSGCGSSSGCTPTTTGFFATPSDAQLQLLSAHLDLPSSNPVVEGLTAYSAMLESLAGLLGPAPRTAAQWVGFGRIDWQVAERHRLTLEGTGANWDAPGGGLTQLSENYGNHSYGSSQASEEWLLARWEAYLTPNLLAVTQASAGRDVQSARPETPSAFEQAFLGPNVNGQLPQIVVDNRYGFTIGNPSRFGQGSSPDERLYHAQQMLDGVHGKLLAKAGFELDHNADSTTMLRNQSGTYVYSKVEDFISDALVFQKFGLQDPNNYSVQHNCGATGATLGSQPCYSHYSQTIGPANWYLSTNDWASYATAQWQMNKHAVFSAGLRWELEQMPPPIAALANPELPQTEKLPSLGSDWGPRVSLAIGEARSRWPVLRLGYGMYYGRTANATIETALTQTGSLRGDLNFFMRPSDDCQHCSGGAPPFPYVFAGQPASVVKPSVVDFAPNFHNPEVHQAVVAVEQSLPSHIELTASAMMSLGRRLPIPTDTNIDTDLGPSTPLQPIAYTVCDQTPAGAGNGACGNLGLGPIKAAKIMAPFYATLPTGQGTCPYYNPASASVPGWLCPDYQQINQIASKANSTYEAAMVRLTRFGSHGLSFNAHYTYAHAMDWNPNESPLDPNPANFSQEYGTSDLDVRHSAAAMVIYQAPWKLREFAGRIANGWMLSGIGQFHSGLPYTMRVTGSLAEEFDGATPIVGLGPGMNGSGGDNRIYGLGSDGKIYDIGRNTFRYPDTWKADLRLAKKFDFGEMRQLELLVETFNLFNHQNVTDIETTGYTIGSGSADSPPTLNFLTGLKTNSTTGLPTPAFGQPLSINGSNFYRERQIQLGLRMRF
jgi:hypothetical protein